MFSSISYIVPHIIEPSSYIGKPYYKNICKKTPNYIREILNTKIFDTSFIQDLITGGESLFQY